MNSYELAKEMGIPHEAIIGFESRLFNHKGIDSKKYLPKVVCVTDDDKNVVEVYFDELPKGFISEICKQTLLEYSLMLRL